MDGALIIDKPAGMTSHDVVQAIRRKLSIQRVGHLGTLDPIATGVLVLLTGRATRLAQFYRHCDKTYRGIIRFGFATDTMDRTGTPLSQDCRPELAEETLRSAMNEFIGPYEQTPPDYSAKKVSGVPAYRMARKGVSVQLKPVSVVIHALRLLWVDGARADFEAAVSSGTYIRSLVNDLGVRLGVGAHLVELQRTALGEFNLEAAIPLDSRTDTLDKAEEMLVPLENLLAEMPRVELNEEDAVRAGYGRDLTLNQSAEWVRLFSPAGSLVGIAERALDNSYHPKIVLVTAEKERNFGAPAASQDLTAGASLLKTILVLCGAAY